VREAWGLQRSGDRIARAVLSAVPHAVQRRDGFLWRADQVPQRFAEFRVPGELRDLEAIAPEELAAAMAWLVDRFGRCPATLLRAETAKLFGRRSTTAAASRTLQPAFDLLLRRGFELVEGDQVRRTGK
jgi:hypothetical protein